MITHKKNNLRLFIKKKFLNNLNLELNNHQKKINLIKCLKVSLLTLLGTTCLYSNSPNAAEISKELDKESKEVYNNNTHISSSDTSSTESTREATTDSTSTSSSESSSDSSSESENDTSISLTESRLVKSLKENYKEGFSGSNSILEAGYAISLIRIHNESIKWIDIPKVWSTYPLDTDKDDSILDGAITLGDIKKQALNLNENAVETLLKCYFYSKFSIQITNIQVQNEFSFLLKIFSVNFPELCKSLHEKSLLKNIWGLPVNNDEILDIYNIFRENESQEGISIRLKEIPYCYLTSFETEYKKIKEMGGEEQSQSKPLKTDNSQLEILLKKSIESQKTIKMWHDMIYDQNALLTSDNDDLKDPMVLEGEVTLRELKRKVLNANYADLETLILAYKDNRFKLPKENYVAQEATEWLSLFSKALESDNQYPLIGDLYAKALTENWFGKVSKFNPGSNEADILTHAAKRSNLAARGLLHLPPFSNHTDLAKKLDKEKKMTVPEKRKDEECIIS